jgi:hypothetical protein
MIQRCTCQGNTAFNRYGGRGITVCPEWEKFDVFMEWAMSNGYKEDLSIDRINNNLGYSSDNCRFASDSQQALNRRRRADNTSGFIGVHPCKGQWKARIQVNKKRMLLGTFDDPFSAAWIRDEFVKHLNEAIPTNNLTDRRRRNKHVKIDRRGTFKMRQL